MASDENAGHCVEATSAYPVQVRELTPQPGLRMQSRFSVHQSDRWRTPTRDEGEGELLWSAYDENAISEHIALSADGRWVAVGYHLNDERFEFRNEDGDVLFSYPVESGPGWVSITADGAMAAYAALDSVWLFRRDGEGVPVFGFGMEGYSPGPVALSRDGGYLVATGSDPDREVNRAYCFRDADEEPVWTFEVDPDEAYGWYGVTIPKDGEIVAVNGKYHLYILDLETGDLIWDAPTYNTESPISLSSDGQILVTGSLSGRLRVFGRGEDDEGYQELWHYTFNYGFSSWVTACRVSADGRTIAAGTLDFHEDEEGYIYYGGHLALFDTYGQGVPLWIAEPLEDEVAEVALSDDGGIVAAVSWGDLDHRTADLVIHERHDVEAFYRLVTPGSMSGLAMSGDGLRVLAGGKAVHNRVFGRGGRVYMVEVTIPGGVVTGVVRDEEGEPVPEAEVSADGNPYTALTDDEGGYRLQVEVEQAREITCAAQCRGFLNDIREDVRVVRGQVTEDADFTLTPAGPPPEGLRGSQGMRNVVVLRWEPYNEDLCSRGGPAFLSAFQRELPTYAAAGGGDYCAIRPTPNLTETETSGVGWGRLTPHPNSSLKIIQWGGHSCPPFNNIQRGQECPCYRCGGLSRDRTEQAERINIYRAYLQGGPYCLIGSVEGDDTLFCDRERVFPRHRYYYVVTADFGDGESEYSAEAVGLIDDDFLVWEADLESMPNPVRIDGVIEDGEWEGAAIRDISDVYGYDAPDSAGSVVVRIGFSDDSDRLFLGFSCLVIEALLDRMGVGVYVDDDGSGRWSYERPGSEGNYWGYWIDGAPDMRYRSLSGPPYNRDPYYHFEDPELAFSDGPGYVEIEMAVPLGFHGSEEVGLYAPDWTIGLGLFTVHLDEQEAVVFNGWWPQDMLSIVSNPEQFARVHIPADLVVPPVAPEDVEVIRDDEALLVSWRDPSMGIDGAELEGLAGIRVYRNDERTATVGPGCEWFLDETIDYGGWYEYSLCGLVMDGDEPFDGEMTAPVGIYAGADPVVDEIGYDDGTPEAYYVVSFEGEDNRFTVRFDFEGPGDTVAVYWIDLFAGAVMPIDVYIAADEDERPGGMIGRRYRTTPAAQGAFHRFHYPGVTQPLIIASQDQPASSCWTVLHYLPDSPGSPSIGVDRSRQEPQRNLYYTLSDTVDGWVGFAGGQLMVRIGAGEPQYHLPPDDDPILPELFWMGQNYPNPFNEVSLIPIRMPESAPVGLRIYDLSGRLVEARQLGTFSAGRWVVPLRAGSLGSGVYFVRIVSGSDEGIVKVSLLK